MHELPELGDAATVAHATGFFEQHGAVEQALAESAENELLVGVQHGLPWRSGLVAGFFVGLQILLHGLEGVARHPADGTQTVTCRRSQGGRAVV